METKEFFDLDEIKTEIQHQPASAAAAVRSGPRGRCCDDASASVNMSGSLTAGRKFKYV